MLLNMGKKTAKAAAGDDMIFDVGTRDFEDRVMRASMDTPVLVDFWAPWCGPCKQLGPVLEAAVRAEGGKIRMAKVNIDENPELAQALRIQSVPAVFAFFGGQPVSAFAGARPQSEVAAFISQIIGLAQQEQPDALDIPQILTNAAQTLADGDAALAQDLYARVLEQDEGNIQAYAGLIRAFLAAGDTDSAREMIEQAPDTIASDPQFAAVKTALDLAENAPAAGELEGLAQKLAKAPDDHQARFDLSAALFAAGQKERAIEELVEIIRRDRAWQDNKARLHLLKIFDALGPADPLTLGGRRKLSAVLFS